MTVKALTKKHNQTDFQRCEQLYEMENKLNKAKQKIKTISDTAESRLNRVNELLKKNNVVVEAHNKLVDKYGAKKIECYERNEQVRAM